MNAVEGHDAPYSAPIIIAKRVIPAEWIDYNGHMNVVYYTKAFDQAMDSFLEDEIGVGEKHAARANQGPYALQNHINYLGEMLEGESFTIRIRMIDCDAKRMHLFADIINENNEVTATCEQMLMNVDLDARRSTPYPEWAQKRMQDMLADHSVLENPAQLGTTIGIRRKG